MKCNRCGIAQQTDEASNKQIRHNLKHFHSYSQDKIYNHSSSQEKIPVDKKKKKPFVERVGDWVCVKCKNLNFSFRTICNRCQLSKPESEHLFEQYMNNLMNCVKLNDILQSHLGPNFSQHKTKIPIEIINYLKNRSQASLFSPNTTDLSDSILGNNSDYFTQENEGHRFGNEK